MTALPPGVRAVVANYARLHPALDRRDLEQQVAWRILHDERRWPWDPALGTLARRQTRLAALELLRFTRRPVWAQVEEPDDMPAELDPIEDRLDRERAVAEVRRILAAETEAARAVLLGEEKSAEVARRLGVKRHRVYDETALAMKRLREALCPRMEAA